MVSHTRKPIDRPQHISFLLPTRGRPVTLRQFFVSLEESTKKKSLIDAWVFVDEDDAVTRNRVEAGDFQNFSFKINWVIRPRARTLGEMLNLLWEACNTHPGIYSPAADDYQIIARGWDEQVRETFSNQVDSVLLAYPTDPTAAQEQVTWPILSAKWTNAVGRFAPGLFPYWFEDTWLDQMAQMVQRKAKLNFRIEPQGGRGKTQRMRNLIFWQLFFDDTLENRVADATMLLQEIAPPKSAAHKAGLEAIAKVAKDFYEQSRVRDFEALKQMEATMADGSDKVKSPFASAPYFNVEMDAVKILYGKVIAAIQRKDFALALRLCENITHSEVQLSQLKPLKRWLQTEAKAVPAQPQTSSNNPGQTNLFRKIFGGT